jgi:hypothetical protein
MPEEPEKNCLRTAIDQIRDFLNGFDCRMAEASALEGIIRGIAKAPGEAWPWVDPRFREGSSPVGQRHGDRALRDPAREAHGVPEP